MMNFTVKDLVKVRDSIGSIGDGVGAMSLSNQVKRAKKVLRSLKRCLALNMNLNLDPIVDNSNNSSNSCESSNSNQLNISDTRDKAISSDTSTNIADSTNITSNSSSTNITSNSSSTNITSNKAVSKTTEYNRTSSIKYSSNNKLKYILMMVLIKTVTCSQAPSSYLGVATPPSDYYVSLVGGPLTYILYTAFLIGTLFFVLQPVAKLYKYQTCLLIAVNNAFLVLHIFAMFHLDFVRIVLVLIALAVGGVIAFLSYTNDRIRTTSILIPAGYLVGYIVVCVLGIMNIFIAPIIIGACSVGAVFAQSVYSKEFLVKVGRGVCETYVLLLGIDMLVPPLFIVQSIHRSAINIVLPFLGFLLSILWGLASCVFVYYEFNRVDVKARIENRGLSEGEVKQGLGVDPKSESVVKQVDPESELV